MLETAFYNRDAKTVARHLLGKIIRHRYKNIWLACQIIETEAYYASEKGSHSSLGYTHKRRAMFMPPGTIYMYYARGADSLNVSVKGEGNAVLIKSAIPYTDALSPPSAIQVMQRLNPVAGSNKKRNVDKLCSGQTLLCRSMRIRVTDWDQKQFDPEKFYIEDAGIIVPRYIQTTRLGISPERDAHLMYRFVDYKQSKFCTSNPLTRRLLQEGTHYHVKNNIPAAC